MKLINFGSGAQYNKQRDLVNVSEDTLGEVMPQDAYGFSKLVMSKFINGQGKNGKKIFNPIIFGLFGPFEDYTFKFISNACMKNILCMPIVINQNVRFDYLYIDDFMTIIDKIIECDDMPNREFNITTTESITLTEIVDIINKIGKNKSEVTVRNPGLNYQYTGDNKKLLENMGNDFKFLTYEESIRRLYSYLEANIDSLDTEAILKDEYIKFCRTKEQDKK
jgi:GDP-L-fucose synthase